MMRWGSLFAVVIGLAIGEAIGAYIFGHTGLEATKSWIDNLAGAAAMAWVLRS